MKKIIIGAMLVALSAPIGMQDADALFRHKKTMGVRNVQKTIDSNINLDKIEDARTELQKAKEALAPMDLRYQSVLKNIDEKSRQNFPKDLVKANKTILENAGEVLNTVYNGSNEKDFTKASKNAEKLKERVQETPNISAVIATLNPTILVEEQSDSSSFKGKLKRNVEQLKAKDKQGREKVAAENRDNIIGGVNTAGSIDNVIYSMDTTKNVLADFKKELSENEVTTNKSTEVLELVTDLVEALKKLRSHTHNYLSATNKVNQYAAKDISDINKTLESLKQGKEIYYKHIAEALNSLKQVKGSNFDDKNPMLQDIATTIRFVEEILTILNDETRTVEKKENALKRGFNSVKNRFSKKTEKEEMTEEKADEDEGEAATEKGEETATKSTSKPKKSFGSRVKSFFGKSKSGSKSKTVRESKSRAI